jgi:putative ABC transport system permease protein
VASLPPPPPPSPPSPPPPPPAASLWAHKMRSILTLLGVVIGVTSVITIVSLINGANRYVAEKVFNLGADVFVLARGPAVILDVDTLLETQRRKKITYDDFQALERNCRRCRDVGASAGRIAEVKHGGNSIVDVGIRGWTPAMPRIFDIELAGGRHILEPDLQRAAPVAVIGWDIREHLFAGIDPIGRELRIGNDVYEVIGIGRKLGTALGQSRDNYVIIPLRTWQKAYGTESSLRIWGKGHRPEDLDAVIDEVRQLMRGRRHVAYADPDDFSIETNQSFLDLWAGISAGFFAATLFIASIALVVGGIVIMNIMLVSVTERTAEIGLRKSVGARSGDILTQFLIESATVAGIGGAIGAAMGIALAKFVSLVTPFPSAIEPWSVLAGLVVATGVGLFFGIYPASKAARLDPVVAMRAAE